MSIEPKKKYTLRFSNGENNGHIPSTKAYQEVSEEKKKKEMGSYLSNSRKHPPLSTPERAEVLTDYDKKIKNLEDMLLSLKTEYVNKRGGKKSTNSTRLGASELSKNISLDENQKGQQLQFESRVAEQNTCKGKFSKVGTNKEVKVINDVYENHRAILRSIPIYTDSSCD